jgi:hypothetical protein
MEITYNVFKRKHPDAVCERTSASLLSADPGYPVRLRCKVLNVSVEGVKADETWYGFTSKGRLININSIFEYASGFDHSPFHGLRENLIRRCGKPKMDDAAQGYFQAHAKWEIAGYTTNMLDDPDFRRCEISVGEDAAWK